MNVQQFIQNNLDLQLLKQGLIYTRILHKDVAQLIIEYVGEIQHTIPYKYNTTRYLATELRQCTPFIDFWITLPSSICCNTADIETLRDTDTTDAACPYFSLVTFCIFPLFCGFTHNPDWQPPPLVCIRSGCLRSTSCDGIQYTDIMGPCRLICCTGISIIGFPITITYDKCVEYREKYIEGNIIKDCTVAGPVEQIMEDCNTELEEYDTIAYKSLNAIFPEQLPFNVR